MTPGLSCSTTVAMLEELGHTVIQANTGEDALRALAEAGRIDLLITDQAMPEMTGARLARRDRRPSDRNSADRPRNGLCRVATRRW